MHTSITRVFAAAAGLAALSALGVVEASASGAATTAPRAVPVTSHAAAVPGAQLWVKRYNGPGNRLDQAHFVAASPGGGKVFVTGQSTGASSGYDYATIAYNTATGARLWASRYNGPANRDDGASSLAVSPDGSKVFVTGYSGGTGSGEDYATVAYNAATGARLWTSRYNGTGNGADRAFSVAVSPGGGRVFVTGQSRGAGSGLDYATVAYRAATGARLWAKRYNGPANSYDSAAFLAVGSGGKTVYVTGSSRGRTSNRDYATLAYGAATGTRLWVKRYDGPGDGTDEARSVAVSPTSGTVFVTGRSEGATSGFDYATLAYRAATGARLWVRRYDGPASEGDGATSLAVSPRGTVFVTGVSWGGRSGDDYATLAYGAATGARLWVKRYDGPGYSWDVANSVAVSPTGGKVFVTGLIRAATEIGDYATLAYSAATGARLWVSYYNGPSNGSDVADSVAVSPITGTVFVTGGSWGGDSGWDYATLAYRG